MLVVFVVQWVDRSQRLKSSGHFEHPLQYNFIKSIKTNLNTSLVSCILATNI